MNAVMPNPLIAPHAQTSWSDRLAFDVALTLENSGFSLTEIFEIHGITASDLAQFNTDPLFLRKVQSFRDEIRDKGVTFRLKARAQAEELLTTSWIMIHDSAISPAVRADLIKSTVRWAGLEIKESTPDGLVSDGVRITINLGPSPTPPMVDARVVDVQAA